MRIHRLLAIASCVLASACSLKPWAPPIGEEFLPNYAAWANEHRADSFRHMVTGLGPVPQDDLLLIGRESGQVEVWNLQGGKLEREFRAHEGRVTHLVPIQRGRRVITSSAFEAQDRVWDIASGALVATIDAGNGPVAPSPDCDHALVTDSSSVHLFDSRKLQLLPTSYRTSGTPTTIVSNSKTRRVAVGTASGSIDVWQFASVDGRASLEAVATRKPYETGEWVIGLQLSDDGSTLYVVTKKGRVEALDATTLARKKSYPMAVQHIWSAHFIAGRQAVALVGQPEAVGLGKTVVEVLNLDTGLVERHPSNTNIVYATWLPQAERLFYSQSRSAVLVPIR